MRGVTLAPPAGSSAADCTYSSSAWRPSGGHLPMPVHDGYRVVSDGPEAVAVIAR